MFLSGQKTAVKTAAPAARAGLLSLCEGETRADAAAFLSDRAELYSVETRETGEIIGVIAFLPCVENRSGRLDLILRRDARGCGFAVDACRVFVTEKLKNEGFNRIYASHDVKNPAAGGVLRSIGMLYEGMSREAFYNADGYHDVHNYAVLKSDLR